MIFNDKIYRRRKYIKIGLISNDIVNKITEKSMLWSLKRKNVGWELNGQEVV